MGANYAKPTGKASDGILRDLGEKGLVDIEAPVYTFDEAGTIEAGDRRDDHKWTYESGLVELPRRLAERADAEIHRGVAVTDVVRADGRWHLRADGGDRVGGFEAVVLATPAPTTAELLPAGEPLDPLRECLRVIKFRSIRSLVFGYGFELDRPYYGLVDVSKDHPIGWIGRESEKRGHVPAGEEVLVVQMSPDWTEENRDRSSNAAAAEAAPRVADLCGDERLADPEWIEDHRWRPALPDGGVPEGLREPLGEEGLYLAGDWIAGTGRIGLALDSGIAAGESIADR